MKKARFTDSQIVEALKRAEAGSLKRRLLGKRHFRKSAIMLKRFSYSESVQHREN